MILLNLKCGNEIKESEIRKLSSSFSRTWFTLHVVTEMHFLLQKNLKNIMHGRVKMYVMR